MADRSDETTVQDAGSPADVVEETERLLSGAGVDDSDRSDAVGRIGDGVVDSKPQRGRSVGEGDDSASQPAAGSERTSWLRAALGRLRPSRPSVGLSSYVSPRAFVVLTAAFAVGFLGGGLTIPLAGHLLGMLVVAFLVGLVGSRRRYLEVGLAGCAVGAVSALFNYAVFLAAGVGGRIFVAGISFGALACLLGYYFGRDLRDGLLTEL